MILCYDAYDVYLRAETLRAEKSDPNLNVLKSKYCSVQNATRRTEINVT